MYHLRKLAQTPQPVVAWHFDFKENMYLHLIFTYQKQAKIQKYIWFKNFENCHVTLWQAHSLPHVSIGDTVPTPPP
jgi:hypothetical protein